MVSPLFSSLHHICVVVPDLEAAEQYYESIGIGPWNELPVTSIIDVSIPLGDFQSLRYRYAEFGGVQLQLCEPGEGDTPQRAFLEQHGSGVFHLGFAVTDVDAAEADGAALGLDVLLRGRRPDASGFSYFGTAAGGVTLQVRSAAGGRSPEQPRS